MRLLHAFACAVAVRSAFLYKGSLSLPLPEVAMSNNSNSGSMGNNGTSMVPTALVLPNITDKSNQPEMMPVASTKPQQADDESKPSSAHLLYAVEMLIYSLVGWAWLAVREIMGDTPVLEVTVLLVMLVSSVLNLLLALTYYTTDQFKHPAQAFLNHTACVWLLYIFCQLQSSTDGRGNICCVEDGTKQSQFSLRLTYKAAYFGGLALHQPPAAITLAFLSIFLILAASQARVCIENPREWPLHGKAPLAVICLLCLQQGVFGVTAPVCKDQDVAAAVIGVIVFAWLALLDLPWILSIFLHPEPMVQLIQAGLEVVLTILIGVMAALLAVNLGSGDALLVAIAVALLWQLGSMVVVFYEIRNAVNDEYTSLDPVVKEAGTVTTTTTSFSSTNSNSSTAAQFRQPYYNSFSVSAEGLPQHMLLPEARDLRRARNHSKKAW
jgi:hypothetical protein